MRLLTRKAPPATPTTFSADALALAIGRTTDEVVQMCGYLGDDFMGRPLIAYAAATLAWEEFVARDARIDEIRWEWRAYVDDRIARRRAVGEAAKAAVRENYGYYHRGGEELERYAAAQRGPEQAALAAFDLAEGPELTISEYREKHR